VDAPAAGRADEVRGHGGRGHDVDLGAPSPGGGVVAAAAREQSAAAREDDSGQIGT
jgi:hypothetical protein